MKQDLEGKVVTKDKLKITVQPKTKEELEDIIEKTIKEKGDHCDLNFIDTSLIADMSGLFMGSSFDGDISKWNVSNVQDMSDMFAEASFDGDISDWDVSNVVTMDRMFWASYFDKDISNWDVSKVRGMIYMFSESEFNRDISKWKVNKDALVQGMFERTYLEENNNLPDWYVCHPNKG